MKGAELIGILQQAEQVVIDDFPLIPMWYDESIAAYRTDRIDQFAWHQFHGPDYGLVAPH